MGYLRPIKLEYYHVSALGWVFGLQLNQSSQPFNYPPQFSPQCFEHSSNYHIHQLQASFDVFAHIPLTLWVSIFCIAPMAMSTHGPMMQFVTLLLPLRKTLIST
jgi:hypothetical protein